MPTFILSLAALLATHAAQGPEIGIERLGEGAYRLTIALEGSADPSAAVSALAPKAGALCGPAGYQFGQYQFKAMAPAPGQASGGPITVTLVQDVTCGSPPAAPAQTEPTRPPAAGAETERLNATVLDLSHRFFAAGDEGRDADAFAMVSPEMTGASLEDWIRTSRDERSRTGPLVSRTIARVTVYADPSGVPPGLYIAADFVATWRDEDECGYLVWHAAKLEGPFELSRKETTRLPHDLDPATRASLRQQYCALL